MAKKGKAKKTPNARPVSHNKPISLRQESTGKLQTKAKPKSFLKLEQLERLPVWASGEGSVPSLAALFGTQVAAAREPLCLPPDPSLFQCQSERQYFNLVFTAPFELRKLKHIREGLDVRSLTLNCRIRLFTSATSVYIKIKREEP